MTVHKHCTPLFHGLIILFSLAIALPLKAGFGDFEDRLKYADHLFSESDYFRALSEYKTLEFFFPGASSASNVPERLCRTYLKAERWFDLDNYILDQKHKNAKIQFMSGISAFKQGKYDSSYKVFDRLDPEKMDAGQKELLLLLKAVDLAQMGRFKETKPLLDAASHGDGAALESAVRIKKGIDYISVRRPKDAVIAGVLSIVPGAGMIYGGHVAEGIGTILAGGLGIYGGYMNIKEIMRDSDWFNLGLWATAFLAFYVNNFTSAIKYAEEYNKNLENYLPLILENDLAVKSFYERNTRKTGPEIKLGVRFPFGNSVDP
jgi:hypothetical protein